MFYLFTDGYQDQFGGKDDKKFSLAQLKQFFLNIHTQDMPVQKELLEDTFTKWLGTRKQIDDVLILGIRL
jgi:serine phosphatase RsbU (regulator of sigma subunit)